MKTNKFNIGDVVRVDLSEESFSKRLCECDLENIEGEEFRITQIRANDLWSKTPTYYTATSYMMFFEEELTLVKTNAEMEEYLNSIGYRG